MTIDLSKFEFIKKPYTGSRPKEGTAFIAVYKRGMVRVSNQFSRELEEVGAKKLDIALTPDRKEILIRPGDTFPLHHSENSKSSWAACKYFSSRTLLNILQSASIPLPVRYILSKHESDIWIGAISGEEKEENK